MQTPRTQRGWWREAARRARAEGELVLAWEILNELCADPFGTPARITREMDEPECDDLLDLASLAIARGVLPHAHLLAELALARAEYRAAQSDCDLLYAAIASLAGHPERAREHVRRADARDDDRVLDRGALLAYLARLELARFEPSAAPRGLVPAGLIALIERVGEQEDLARAHVLCGHRALPCDPRAARSSLLAARELARTIEAKLACYRLASAIALVERDLLLARREARDGREMAACDGFELFAIDLAIDEAAAHLADAAIEPALSVLDEAKHRATRPACSYGRGRAAAAHLGGMAHLMAGDWTRARAALDVAARGHRPAIDHPILGSIHDAPALLELATALITRA